MILNYFRLFRLTYNPYQRVLDFASELSSCTLYPFLNRSVHTLIFPMILAQVGVR